MWGEYDSSGRPLFIAGPKRRGAAPNNHVEAQESSTPNSTTFRDPKWTMADSMSEAIMKVVSGCTEKMRPTINGLMPSPAQT
jgi:hypothetical protein